jgi:hypothetical protein
MMIVRISVIFVTEKTIIGVSNVVGIEDIKTCNGLHQDL